LEIGWKDRKTNGLRGVKERGIRMEIG